MKTHVSSVQMRYPIEPLDMSVPLPQLASWNDQRPTGCAPGLDVPGWDCFQPKLPVAADVVASTIVAGVEGASKGPESGGLLPVHVAVHSALLCFPFSG